MTAKTVLICQNTACRKAGSAAVLAAFQANLQPDLPDLTVVGCRCLGHCGNGPMVLILPEQIWYNRVHPDQVLAIIQRHLQ